MLVSIRKSRKK